MEEKASSLGNKIIKPRTQEELLFLNNEELISVLTNQDYMVKELRRVMIYFAVDSVWSGLIALQSLWKQNHNTNNFCSDLGDWEAETIACIRIVIQSQLCHLLELPWPDLFVEFRILLFLSCLRERMAHFRVQYTLYLRTRVWMRKKLGLCLGPEFSFPSLDDQVV